MIPGHNVKLRPIEPEDLDLVWRLANEPSITASVVGWSFPTSREAQRNWIRTQADDTRTRRLVILDPEGESVGITGLWDIDWHNQSAFSGVKLLPSSHGRGLATDAVLTTMAWAFYVVGLRRLHSTVLQFNTPSLKLYLQRCGWREEGCELESVFRAGKWWNLVRIAALRSDFDRLDGAAARAHRLAPVPTDPSRTRSCAVAGEAPMQGTGTSFA
jgi:RimJ/RimL family protein N-acetyltransferase